MLNLALSLASMFSFQDTPSLLSDPCGESLYKRVKSTNGKIIYRPRLVYCYKSVIDSLQEMLLRPNFFISCEEWRKRKVKPDLFCDVFDGMVWKDFQTVDGKPFLSVPYSFAFQLNIDWFQPFTHTTHSEGVIYLSVMNLPKVFARKHYSCRSHTRA